MKLQNQKGFAHLSLVLLIVAVLGAVGGGGYYVWRKNHEQKNTNADSSQQKKATEITSYDECVKSEGSRVQESYPPVCVTKDLKHFTQSLLADVTLQNSQLKFAYDKTFWNVLQESQSRIDESCGKQDGVTLGYGDSAFLLSFNLGTCGKGGGACFYEENSDCVAESKEVAQVDLSNRDTKYVIAHRTSTDNGKTWSYEVGLSDRKTCTELCGFTVAGFKSNPSLITGKYQGEGDLPGNPQTLADFADLPEVQATVKLLKTLNY